MNKILDKINNTEVDNNLNNIKLNPEIIKAGNILTEELEKREKNDIEEIKERYGDIKSIEEKDFENIYQDFNNAKKRLLNTPKFKEKFGDSDISLERFLPLIIKESFLDQDKISKSDAIGYFQLKDLAIQDAEDIIYNEFNVSKSKKYEPKESGEDNCILGIVYFLHLEEIVKEFLPKDIGETDINNFVLASYNMGITRFKNIYNLFSDNGKNKLNRDEFSSKLIKKTGTPEGKQIIFDYKYKICYKQKLNEQLSKNENIAIEEKGCEITKAKIYEVIRYVDIINSLENKKENIFSVIILKEKQTLRSKIEELINLEILKNININDLIAKILKENNMNESNIQNNKPIYITENIIKDNLNIYSKFKVNKKNTLYDYLSDLDKEGLLKENIDKAVDKILKINNIILHTSFTENNLPNNLILLIPKSIIKDKG